MKKSILIMSTLLIILSLSAFGFIHQGDFDSTQNNNTVSKTIAWAKAVFSDEDKQAEVDFFYNIDSRFGTTITKEKLHRATSVVDIVPEEAEWSKVSFLNMKVAILQGDNEIHALGDDEVLNAAQATLLQSADYSTSFYLKGRGKRKDAGPNGLKDNNQEEFDFTYYLTVTPEKEAKYTGGQDALIGYLKENSIEKTAIVKQDRLERGSVSFTITKKGTIAKVKLSSTSGYPSIDYAMVELINKLPETWEPATNFKGDKIDQEFVFSFGRGGC
jgi:hypothetical protein